MFITEMNGITLMTRNQQSNATFCNRHPVIIRNLVKLSAEMREASEVKILSFGCSTGLECLSIKSFLPNTRVFGCDLDEAILIKAKRLCQDQAMIFKSNFENLQRHGPFQIICAFNVLCRHPIKDGLMSDLYPFSQFNQTLALLDGCLSIGGWLAIYNAQYDVAASSIASRYAPAACPELRNNGWLDKYNALSVRTYKSGRLAYQGKKMKHSHWLRLVQNSGEADADPAKLDVFFELLLPRENHDLTTVIWEKKLEM